MTILAPLTAISLAVAAADNASTTQPRPGLILITPGTYCGCCAAPSFRHPSATGPTAALLLVVAMPPVPHRPGPPTLAPGPSHDHSELRPPYQRRAVRSSVCALSD